MNKAVFLDRDGVINEVIMIDGKPNSPHTPEEFIFTPGIKDFVRGLKDKGYLIIVVTNQPDLARGNISPDGLDTLHKLMCLELPIDQVYVCQHRDEDNCSCRKPQPGMLTQAAEQWDIDLKASFIIGDQWRDIGAGKNAGCRTILISAPYNKEVQADYVIHSLEPVTFENNQSPFIWD